MATSVSSSENQVMCSTGIRAQHFKRCYKNCLHPDSVAVRFFTGHCFFGCYILAIIHTGSDSESRNLLGPFSIIFILVFIKYSNKMFTTVTALKNSLPPGKCSVFFLSFKLVKIFGIWFTVLGVCHFGPLNLVTSTTRWRMSKQRNAQRPLGDF